MFYLMEVAFRASIVSPCHYIYREFKMKAFCWLLIWLPCKLQMPQCATIPQGTGAGLQPLECSACMHLQSPLIAQLSVMWSDVRVLELPRVCGCQEHISTQEHKTDLHMSQKWQLSADRMIEWGRASWQGKGHGNRVPVLSFALCQG